MSFLVLGLRPTEFLAASPWCRLVRYRFKLADCGRVSQDPHKDAVDRRRFTPKRGWFTSCMPCCTTRSTRLRTGATSSVPPACSCQSPAAEQMPLPRRRHEIHKGASRGTQTHRSVACGFSADNSVPLVRGPDTSHARRCSRARGRLAVRGPRARRFASLEQANTSSTAVIDLPDAVFPRRCSRGEGCGEMRGVHYYLTCSALPSPRTRQIVRPAMVSGSTAPQSGS